MGGSTICCEGRGFISADGWLVFVQDCAAVSAVRIRLLVISRRSGRLPRIDSIFTRGCPGLLATVACSLSFACARGLGSAPVSAAGLPCLGAAGGVCVVASGPFDCCHPDYMPSGGGILTQPPYRPKPNRQTEMKCKTVEFHAYM